MVFLLQEIQRLIYGYRQAIDRTHWREP
jgi:hypothetical protein